MPTVNYTVGGNRQKRKITETANAAQQGSNGTVKITKVSEQETMKEQYMLV